LVSVRLVGWFGWIGWFERGEWMGVAFRGGGEVRGGATLANMADMLCDLIWIPPHPFAPPLCRPGLWQSGVSTLWFGNLISLTFQYVRLWLLATAAKPIKERQRKPRELIASKQVINVT